MPHPPLQSCLGVCRRKLQERLLEFDIQENFVLRIKPAHRARIRGQRKRDPDWLGIYRSNSQFSGRPIFWINEQLPQIVAQFNAEEGGNVTLERVLLDTLFHEYGHVVWEFAHSFRSNLEPLRIQLRHLGSDGETSNEEDFAETFCRFMARRPDIGDPLGETFEAMLTTYRQLAFQETEENAALSTS